MANLLRRSRSMIRRNEHNSTGNVNNDTPPPLPPKDSNISLFQRFNSIQSRRKSRIDLSTAVESEKSAAIRQQREEQLQKQHSISHLRRRLIRKASTFNLHTRHRSSPPTDPIPPRDEKLFPDIGHDPDRPGTALQELERPSTASTVYSETPETILQRPRSDSSNSDYSQLTTVPIRRHTLAIVHPYDDKPLPNPSRQSSSVNRLIAHAQQEVLKAQAELTEKHHNYQEKHTEGLGIWVKMATPSAEPPLAYDKLKQITVEACDTALSGTTSYDHSKTESWNTTIINTMLSQIVGETEASDPQSQSKWKFVVNSTIIQHKSNTVTQENGSKSSGGRRGMHSAAGAYWNNAKDGMWSFKYEAAEKLGLDVVVGVVWIWVG
ncbi:hypothetical protein LTR05_001928 [Lithohypha guttulata]|uniref:Uncharacterized protein n=1 Tax=Lithohypha guttulata TaxID=1690604 RepID=A0AAN7YKL3_9EURO|nr:hypothetical protein LTR05_001928 [Lithohypha guttulata]